MLLIQTVAQKQPEKLKGHKHLILEYVRSFSLGGHSSTYLSDLLSSDWHA